MAWPARRAGRRPRRHPGDCSPLPGGSSRPPPATAIGASVRARGELIVPFTAVEGVGREAPLPKSPGLSFAAETAMPVSESSPDPPSRLLAAVMPKPSSPAAFARAVTWSSPVPPLRLFSAVGSSLSLRANANRWSSPAPPSRRFVAREPLPSSKPALLIAFAFKRSLPAPPSRWLLAKEPDSKTSSGGNRASRSERAEAKSTSSPLPPVRSFASRSTWNSGKSMPRVAVATALSDHRHRHRRGYWRPSPVRNAPAKATLATALS